jgi:hypothetical protein
MEVTLLFPPAENEVTVLVTASEDVGVALERGSHHIKIVPGLFDEQGYASNNTLIIRYSSKA